MSPLNERPELLLERARTGDASQLGRLLGLYRKYLMLLAAAQIDATLGNRMDASDLVQETLLEAHRDFSQFKGKSEAELLSWLRRILVCNLMDHARYHGAQQRDWHREQSLQAALERSSQRLNGALAAATSTPSMAAGRREVAVLLADALDQLPAAYQQAILLRNVQQLKFSEIAERMGRSTGAVRMLWVRALEQLRQSLEKSQ